MSFNERSKMNKQISIHHLYYAILIAGLILLFVILIFPYGVSRYAFDNFSFASTITSIVLAVVSIVYSIISGNTSSGQLESVREINSEIKKQLDGFSHIEENISKLVNDKVSQVQSEVKTVSEGQKEMSVRISEIGKNFMTSPNTDNNNDLADFSHNSAYGDLLLYACSLSVKTGKPFPASIFDNNLNDYNYWFGYLVALTVCYPQKIRFDREKETEVFLFNVTSFDEAFFGTSDVLKARIKKNIEEENENNNLYRYLKSIDNYYAKSEEAK